jgi:hypothetical protein
MQRIFWLIPILCAHVLFAEETSDQKRIRSEQGFYNGSHSYKNCITELKPLGPICARWYEKSKKTANDPNSALANMAAMGAIQGSPVPKDLEKSVTDPEALACVKEAGKQREAHEEYCQKSTPNLMREAGNVEVHLMFNLLLQGEIQHFRSHQEYTTDLGKVGGQTQGYLYKVGFVKPGDATMGRFCNDCTADKSKFRAIAFAQYKGIPKLDVWTIDQSAKLVQVQDGLPPKVRVNVDLRTLPTEKSNCDKTINPDLCLSQIAIKFADPAICRSVKNTHSCYADFARWADNEKSNSLCEKYRAVLDKQSQSGMMTYCHNNWPPEESGR